MLPCIKHNIPCPYIDRRGKDYEWTCCGVRPPRRLIGMRECPQIEVARAEYSKQKQKSGV